MRSPGDARVREGDRARVRARVGRKRARDEDATDETGRRMRRRLETSSTRDVGALDANATREDTDTNSFIVTDRAIASGTSETCGDFHYKSRTRYHHFLVSMRLHRRVNRRRDDLAAVRVTWIPHQTDARVRSLDNDAFAFTLSISQPFRRLLAGSFQLL